MATVFLFSDFSIGVDSVSTFSNSQKIAYLHFFLPEKVKNGIAQLLYNPDLYSQVMTELERQYGHLYLIALALIRTMLELMSDNTPPLPSQNSQTFQMVRKFSTNTNFPQVKS